MKGLDNRTTVLELKQKISEAQKTLNGKRRGVMVKIDTSLYLAVTTM
jgi:hypothetical protein